MDETEFGERTPQEGQPPIAIKKKKKKDKLVVLERREKFSKHGFSTCIEKGNERKKLRECDKQGKGEQK